MNAAAPLVSILLLVSLGASTVASAPPSWVTGRPSVSGDYIGIGHVGKDVARDDFQTVAKSKALSDLASEIAVTVVSDHVLESLEIGDTLAEEYRAHISTSTAQNLDGYEIVDTWEGDGQYWVYCRLAKAEYAARRRAAREKAEALALDHLRRARSAEQTGAFGPALSAYVEGVRALEEFLGETTTVKSEGADIYLSNELYASLARVLGDLTLAICPASLDVQYDRRGKHDFLVYMSHAAPGGTPTPVGSVPVAFSFRGGGGDVLEGATTDSRGEARGSVLEVTSRKPTQIVAARVDVARLAGADPGSATFRTLFGRVTAPEARLVLNVSGSRLLVTVSESNLGHPMSIPIVEPLFKRELAAQGFTFVDTVNGADFRVEIEAGSRSGVAISGKMYSAFAELRVSLTDLATGEELYQNVLTGEKGIQLSYDKAGIKALEAAGAKAAGVLVREVQSAMSR